ncbi:hypothetical protein Q7P35_005505 [Cladosporium inversicolor]
MKLSNVLPALFSLPKLGPQIAQHSNQYSDVSRLSVHDVKLSPILNDDPRSTLEDVREDALGDDLESLSARPELMSDDEYGDHSGAATPRASSRPSNQSNNPHARLSATSTRFTSAKRDVGASRPQESRDPQHIVERIDGLVPRVPSVRLPIQVAVISHRVLRTLITQGRRIMLRRGVMVAVEDD